VCLGGVGWAGASDSGALRWAPIMMPLRDRSWPVRSSWRACSRGAVLSNAVLLGQSATKRAWRTRTNLFSVRRRLTLKLSCKRVQ
jgi:hypothetical protein